MTERWRRRVIAFEPNPDSLKVLLLNTLSAGDAIRVYHFAASDREGFLSLMRIVSIASTKRVAEAELRYPSDVSLAYAVRLDAILHDEARVDVLKCDVDGHDYLAIRGGLGMLTRTLPVVFAEFNPARSSRSARSSPWSISGSSPSSATRSRVLPRRGARASGAERTSGAC